jgi:hypothetical protein
MATICYSDPCVPVELIAACGHTACRPRPAAAGFAEIEGLCAWAGAFCAAARQTDAAIFTTGCDQMRRLYELHTTQSPRPAFLLNIPKTTSPTARDMLCEEFKRLKRFLLALDGGEWTPERLADQMAHRPAETADIAAADTAGADRGLAVIGGPLFEDDYASLCRRICQSGLSVVFDGTEPAWPALRVSRPLPSVKSDPTAMLAESCLAVPAVWKRPAGPFFDRLCVLIHRRPILGVIVVRHPFCDYWKAAMYDLRNRLTMPLVAIETNQNGRLSTASLSRVEALLEQCGR